MALERLRSRWEILIKPLISKMENVSPSLITWSTLPIAFLACYLLLIAGKDKSGAMLLFAGFGLIILTGIFDALDGNLARTYGKTSRHGDFLDHTIDRIIDISLILAIAHNSYWIVNPVWGWAAALATLMGSYMGTQAQSVGLNRNYGGFGRADRMIITIFGVLLASGQAFFEISDPMWLGIEWNPLVLIIFVSLIGGLYTFFRRFIATSRDLHALDTQEPLTHTKSTSSVDE
jgi:phosphatidylglycerophosphate synthase